MGTSARSYRLIDIGSNLVDEMYQGIYNGSKKHEPDLDKVLQRAFSNGLQKIFVSSGNLEESQKAAKLVADFDPPLQGKPRRLFSTVGVHPTRCSEFLTKFDTPQQYVNHLKNVYQENKKSIVALGEFGLDTERTNFCDFETQKKFFTLQLTELGPFFNLPLFLHCRGAANDMHQILSENVSCFQRGGVVHSFDGTVDEMKSFLALGLHIGINGCSLKTEDNCAVVKEIPLNSLLLETDSPWCGIRPSHASFKFIKTKFEASKKNWAEDSMFKQRNEPQTLVNILEVVAALKEIAPEQLSEIVYKNTLSVFFPDEAV